MELIFMGGDFHMHSMDPTLVDILQFIDEIGFPFRRGWEVDLISDFFQGNGSLTRVDSTSEERNEKVF